MTHVDRHPRLPRVPLKVWQRTGRDKCHRATTHQHLFTGKDLAQARHLRQSDLGGSFVLRGDLSSTYAPHWHLALSPHTHLIPPVTCPGALCPLSQPRPPHPSPGALPQHSWYPARPLASLQLHSSQSRLSAAQANTQVKDCPTSTTCTYTCMHARPQWV